MRIDQVLAELRNLRKDNEAILIRGVPMDYAEYRYFCGYVRALDELESIIEYKVKEGEEDDD